MRPEHFQGNRPSDSRSGGVRDGVQRKDRRDRFINILSQFLEDPSGGLPFFHKRFNMTDRYRVKDRLEQRTDRRGDDNDSNCD